MVASCVLLTGDVAHNPGMCPDWELNQQSLASQAVTQSTEPQKWRSHGGLSIGRRRREDGGKGTGNKKHNW